MDNKLQELKAKCFDLQEANTSLSNYLVEIAKVLGVSDINHVFPEVVRLVENTRNRKDESAQAVTETTK